jgi:hypothetical protein
MGADFATVSTVTDGAMNETFFPTLAQKSDDIVEVLLGKVIRILRILAGNVDSDLGHDGNRYGVDGRGLRSGRKSRNPVTQVVIDKPLGHLGTAGIAGAQEKGSDFHKKVLVLFSHANATYLRIHALSIAHSAPVFAL